MDELLKDFLVETGEHIEAVTAQLVRFERDPGDTRIIANIFRLVHSIKGTCGFLDLPRLEAVAHAAETLIGRLRDGAAPTQDAVTLVLRAVDRIKQIVAGIEATETEPAGDDSQLIAELVSRASGVRLRQPDNEVWDGPEPDADGGADSASALAADARAGAHAMLPERRTETVRVSVGTLERLMSLVSELVLARNQLLDRARGVAADALEAPLQRLTAVTVDLQHGVMKARMQPIGRLFAGLPRIVRDMSAELGKKIEVATSGGDTELDRQLIAMVRDPLTHMIRNAVGHGIETPQERRAAGKRETGLISVNAYHDAGSIVIEVSDDGRGVDVDAIRVKAVARGVAREAEVACLSDADVCRFIFAPGFSTAHAVTPLQGRGVGMDVVRENIEAIGGSVALSSTLGVGASFVLKIPITLAIAPALVVVAGGARFALPQDGVVEVYELGEGETRVETMQGASVVFCPRGMLTAGDLRDVLGFAEAADERPPATHVVVLRVGARQFGLLVEDIVEVLDIVVKPLPAKLVRIGMYSGNTILGDGSIMLILDVAGLAAALGIEKQDTFRVAERGDEARGDETACVVLFRVGSGPLQALPASLVRRIDRVNVGDLARVDGGLATRIDGRLTPVVGCAERPDDVAKGAAILRPLLTIGRADDTVGLLVDEIVDVIDARLVVEMSGRKAGVLGTASLAGEVVEIPDIAWIMEQARPGFARRAAFGRPLLALCDSEAFFRDLLRAVLTGAGYDVLAVDDAEAVWSALAQAPAALLVDCDGQAAAGLELTRRLRASQDYAHLPIIGLVAHATPAARRRVADAGCDEAVGKFDRSALTQVLRGLLEPDFGAAQEQAA